MGQLIEYGEKRRQPYMGQQRDPNDKQVGTALNGGLYVPSELLKTPAAEPAAPQNTEIDTTDALGSLVGMLETPAEREAKERRLLEHRNKMQMWFGLFDGLRQLGNLYATAKGASPQNLTSTAPVIDQQYEQQRQLYNGLANYRNNYAQQLYNLHRQNEADKRTAETHQAQLDWYKTRDEMARLKAENDKMKTEKYVELQDGRIAKLNAETGQIEEMTPYKTGLLEAQAQKNRQQGNAAVIRANKTGTSGKKNGGSQRQTRRSRTQL